MAYLGTPYRIIYEAKNLATGITGIRAIVAKSDLTVAGVFSMTEMPFGSLQGVYYCDLISSLNDPEGEWIGAVLSPSEGVRSSFRISFQKNPIAEIQSLIRGFLANGLVDGLRGYIDSSKELKGLVGPGVELTGYVLNDDVSAELEDHETIGESEITSTLEGDLENGI